MTFVVHYKSSARTTHRKHIENTVTTENVFASPSDGYSLLLTRRVYRHIGEQWIPLCCHGLKREAVYWAGDNIVKIISKMNFTEIKFGLLRYYSDLYCGGIFLLLSLLLLNFIFCSFCWASYVCNIAAFTFRIFFYVQMCLCWHVTHEYVWCSLVDRWTLLCFVVWIWLSSGGVALI
jgi:hypothetical protein